MRFPLNRKIDLIDIPAPNRWGYPRKFDVHTGVDLFAPDGEPVYAIENCQVIKTGVFTGESIGMPWWHETHFVAVKGRSGFVLYGEIYPPKWNKGDSILEGEEIGQIKTVLKVDKGRPMSMLHIELYNCHFDGWCEWELNGIKPAALCNIEQLIFRGDPLIDFVPFDLAKEMKTRGFDELGLAHWRPNPNGGQDEFVLSGLLDRYNSYEGITLSPTWSQVQAWIEKRYGVTITISHEYYKDGINWNWQISWYLPENLVKKHHFYDGSYYYGDTGDHPIRENAIEAAIREILKRF
jgi:hypothetical protein